MSVPTYDNFIFPLLQLLAQNPEGLKVSQTRSLLVERMGLEEEQVREMLPSGRQSVFHNRVGWAHDRLKRAGFSTSVRRGFWKVTEEGAEFVRRHPNGVNELTQRQLAFVPTGSTLRKIPPAKISGNESTGVIKQKSVLEAGVKAPDERIEEAVLELNESLSAELLAQILEASPDFFERMVLDLLVKMDYGVTRSEIQQTGGSGDGGIDGVIALDKLGLEKVYIQAKRWSNKVVGRPHIQSFYGALAGRRSTRGVFLTTSTFSKEAHTYAKQVSDSIVLVDGARLTDLMIDHEVGVSVARVVRIAEMDSDYFDEE